MADSQGISLSPELVSSLSKDGDLGAIIGSLRDGLGLEESPERESAVEELSATISTIIDTPDTQLSGTQLEVKKGFNDGLEEMRKMEEMQELAAEPTFMEKFQKQFADALATALAGKKVDLDENTEKLGAAPEKNGKEKDKPEPAKTAAAQETGEEKAATEEEAVMTEKPRNMTEALKVGVKRASIAMVGGSDALKNHDRNLETYDKLQENGSFDKDNAAHKELEENLKNPVKAAIKDQKDLAAVTVEHGSEFAEVYREARDKLREDHAMKLEAGTPDVGKDGEALTLKDKEKQLMENLRPIGKEFNEALDQGQDIDEKVLGEKVGKATEAAIRGEKPEKNALKDKKLGKKSNEITADKDEVEVKSADKPIQEQSKEGLNLEGLDGAFKGFGDIGGGTEASLGDVHPSSGVKAPAPEKSGPAKKSTAAIG